MLTNIRVLALPPSESCINIVSLLFLKNNNMTLCNGTQVDRQMLMIPVMYKLHKELTT